MEITEMPVESIRPYENNPRNNEPAIDKCANSIREFGWRQPIVVDADGVIVCGHTRYYAALKLGLATVPVHVARDLSPEKIAAYRLADNKVAELATWDFAKLDAELKKLGEAMPDFDMASFGFEEKQPDENPKNEGGGVDPAEIFDAKVSLIIDCESDEDAERKFKTATEDLGWKARLSTL